LATWVKESRAMSKIWKSWLKAPKALVTSGAINHWASKVELSTGLAEAMLTARYYIEAVAGLHLVYADTAVSEFIIERLDKIPDTIKPATESWDAYCRAEHEYQFESNKKHADATLFPALEREVGVKLDSARQILTKVQESVLVDLLIPSIESLERSHIDFANSAADEKRAKQNTTMMDEVLRNTEFRSANVAQDALNLLSRTMTSVVGEKLPPECEEHKKNWDVHKDHMKALAACIRKWGDSSSNTVFGPADLGNDIRRFAPTGVMDPASTMARFSKAIDDYCAKLKPIDKAVPQLKSRLTAAAETMDKATDAMQPLKALGQKLAKALKGVADARKELQELSARKAKPNEPEQEEKKAARQSELEGALPGLEKVAADAKAEFVDEATVSLPESIREVVVPGLDSTKDAVLEYFRLAHAALSGNSPEAPAASDVQVLEVESNSALVNPVGSTE